MNDNQELALAGHTNDHEASSPAAWSGSGIVTESGSPNTVLASANPTLWFPAVGRLLLPIPLKCSRTPRRSSRLSDLCHQRTGSSFAVAAPAKWARLVEKGFHSALDNMLSAAFEAERDGNSHFLPSRGLTSRAGIGSSRLSGWIPKTRCTSSSRFLFWVPSA